ncbi:MAG TPA: hemolysin family protein [Candidatus Saccharimonadales bacterium]|nr:hemolysin family protein [Candidatus Saccharimonadales bacterium]
MEILIVLLLIILNAFFAIAEISIVTARKSRLKQLAHDGNKNAIAAVELSHSPNRFLSTTQIGMTFIGIFAGAFGEKTITANLANYLKSIAFLSPYAETIALVIVVSLITYLTIVVGELVPKRIGLNNPEKFARVLARPMLFVSSITSPLISLLSNSTDFILKILQINSKEEPMVSEEEVRMLIREGTRAGVFLTTEKDIVERTFSMSDKKVQSLMVHRAEIVYLDVDSTFASLKKKISKSPHSYYPVADSNLDNILGIIRTEDILTNFLIEGKIDLRKHLHKALFVPEGTTGLKVLEQFKKSGIHVALIIDEYGNIQGLASLNDILEAIVGDIPSINQLEEKEFMKRDDGSYLVDGTVPIDEFKEHFDIKRFPSEKSGLFHTIGGFVMDKIDRIPVTGDKVEIDNFNIEVVDMDGHRVDKILVSPKNN